MPTLDYRQLYIGGQWRDPAQQATIDVQSPTTEEIIGSVPRGSRGDIDAAVAAGEQAEALDAARVGPRLLRIHVDDERDAAGEVVDEVRFGWLADYLMKLPVDEAWFNNFNFAQWGDAAFDEAVVGYCQVLRVDEFNECGFVFKDALAHHGGGIDVDFLLSCPDFFDQQSHQWQREG